MINVFFKLNDCLCKAVIVMKIIEESGNVAREDTRDLHRQVKMQKVW